MGLARPPRKSGSEVIPGERFPPMEGDEELVFQDDAVLCPSFSVFRSFLFGLRPGFLRVTTKRLIWQDYLTSFTRPRRPPVVIDVGEIRAVEHVKRFLVGDILRLTTSERVEFKIPSRNSSAIIDQYVRLIRKLMEGT